MRVLLVLFNCILVINAFSQSKITYNNGHCASVFFNEDYKPVRAVNVAKNVTITYDTFFKSYHMTMLTDEGNSVMNLSYVGKDNPSDTLITYYEEKSPGDIEYYKVSDHLKDSNNLYVYMVRRRYGLAVVMTFCAFDLNKTVIK